MQIVQRILNGEKFPPFSQELGIHCKSRPRCAATLGADLERMLAHQQLVIEFYRQVLQQVERLSLGKRERCSGETD